MKKLDKSTMKKSKMIIFSPLIKVIINECIEIKIRKLLLEEMGNELKLIQKSINNHNIIVIPIIIETIETKRILLILI